MGYGTSSYSFQLFNITMAAAKMRPSLTEEPSCNCCPSRKERLLFLHLLAMPNAERNTKILRLKKTHDHFSIDQLAIDHRSRRNSKIKQC